MDEWEENMARPLPKWEFKQKEGSILFVQTGQGKFDKYEVIDGELVFQSTLD